MTKRNIHLSVTAVLFALCGCAHTEQQPNKFHLHAVSRNEKDGCDLLAEKRQYTAITAEAVKEINARVEELSKKAPKQPYKKPYTWYGGHYFSPEPAGWKFVLYEKTLKSMRGKSDLHYLEVGVGDGRNLIWMLENILTDPSSRAYATICRSFAKNALKHNLILSGEGDRVNVYGNCLARNTYLPMLIARDPVFEIIRINGNHENREVLFDALSTWQLLKPGGVMIVDGHLWAWDRGNESATRYAVEAFISAQRSRIEILHVGRMVLLRKRRGAPCVHCYRLGNYYYNWNKGTLNKIETKEVVPISDVEKRLLIELIKRRRRGAPAEVFFADDLGTLRDAPEFRQLAARLNLIVKSH